MAAVSVKLLPRIIADTPRHIANVPARDQAHLPQPADCAKRRRRRVLHTCTRPPSDWGCW